jgi:hypothetical protein
LEKAAADRKEAMSNLRLQDVSVARTRALISAGATAFAFAAASSRI